MTIILDNGHGIDTAGKRSPVWPDGSQLLEWEFNRDIVRRIASALQAAEIDFTVLVPEDRDIPLAERVMRANRFAASAKAGSLLVSVHANAGGGTGWEAYTGIGRTKSDDYAAIFYQEAAGYFPQAKIRVGNTAYGPAKQANFYILSKTVCPAILTENFFMDTEEDCRILMSESGREKIAGLHISAIKRCIRL